MAYTVNWLTKVVSVPQADLTLVSAGIYELNVLDFWAAIHDIQDGEGIPYVDIMQSNAPVTISGVTYVRSLEVINGYTVEFEDGQYQVNLVGANNNILDARVQNQVSINPSNSAGAVQVGSGLTSGQDTTLTAILSQLTAIEGTEDHNTMMRLFRAALVGKGGDDGSGNFTYRDAADTKDRITAVTSNGNRTSVTVDAS